MHMPRNSIVELFKLGKAREPPPEAKIPLSLADVRHRGTHIVHLWMRMSRTYLPNAK